jgi:amidophosphoribosyltransferase
MCGIVGIIGDEPVALDLYNSLTVLQHRGQDAAGIATADGRRFIIRKKDGLVREVFKQRHMDKLVGNLGIGHVRYPTAGTNGAIEAQPFYVNSPYGIALVHNGTLTNSAELAERMFDRDYRHLNTASDSEVLVNVLAHEITKANGNFHAAVKEVMKKVTGAYSVIAMIMGKGLLAFRDPHGIRPLVFGERDGQYMAASESVALSSLGFNLMYNVPPGGAVFVPFYKTGSDLQHCVDSDPHPCIFEYVYLARPDSMIEGISVYKSRLRMGEKLGERINKMCPNYSSKIDVVIPIPETSRTTAITLAATIKRPLREGFVKNRYIGRTFIMPDQNQREKSIRHKLNPIDLEFRDKNVLLVDDSIVRGTTSIEIVKMVRKCGANSVYLASAAPPIRYPNVYGIDMPSSSELIAYNRTEAQIRDIIGCDGLLYQTLPDLIDAVKHYSSTVSQFDTSIFDGYYVTGDITPDYLLKLEEERSNGTRT